MRALVSLASRIMMHPVTLALVCLAGVGFAYGAENAVEPVPFAMAIVATVISVLFLITSRIAFSVYIGWSIVAVLTLASAIKYAMKGFSLHFYDAYFFAGDAETYRFLIENYLPLLVPFLVVMAGVVTLGVLFFRADRRTSWPLIWRMAPLAVAMAMLPITYPKEAADSRTTYYIQGRHLSASFVSLLDSPNLLVTNELERRLVKTPPLATQDAGVNCGETADRPDLFIVLSESTVDPSMFPQVKDGKGFLKRFAPDSGTPHPMSVETYGGGTWISNLSLQTGLSATDFGWRSPYLTLMLEGKVGGSLPETLAKCGYRTAVLLPMQENFVNEGPFLQSIGYETVIDKDDIGATNYHLRDDFYYEAAERFIARHRETDGRPLLLMIETMFPHSPYNERLEPEVKVEGEPFSDNPDVAEYLRRVAIARKDFQVFLEHRKTSPTDRGSIVLEFGDHHSIATRSLVEQIEGEGAVGRLGSLAYSTYYSVASFNYTMKEPMPSGQIDIGFVGASLLKAAGLPMSPVMSDLVALRDVCGGRFHDCRNRAAMDQHLRSRVEEGALDLFGPESNKDQLLIGSIRGGLAPATP